MMVLSQKKGLALPGVIMVLFVMTALGISLWVTGFSERTQVDRFEKKLQAHFLARSGVEAVASYFRDPANAARINDYLGVESQPVDLDLGSFQILITSAAENPSNSIRETLLVEATGTVDGVTQKAQAILRPSSILGDAAIASYDLDMAGLAHLIENGNVFYEFLSGTVNVEEGFVAESKDFEFPPVEYPKDFPDKDDLIGDANIGGGGLLSIDDLNENKIGYWEPSISLTGQSNMEVELGESGPEILKLKTRSFDLRSELRIKGEGTFVLYIKEDFDARGAADIVIEEEDTYIIVILKDDAEFNLGPGIQFRGIIYGPGASIDIGGQGNVSSIIQGAVIGENVDVRGNVTIARREFDPDAFPQLQNYRLSRWINPN